MKRLGGRICAGCVVLTLCLLPGCGSDDNGQSDELVAMRFQGTFDFRLDDSDGPEDILHLDEGEIIDQDGAGTRTSSAYDGSRPFQVPASELDRLKGILPQLDLDDLEARFGAKGSDDTTTTFRYGGKTVTLGDHIDASHGEGDDLFHEAASIINHASIEALPPRIKSIDKTVNRENRSLNRKLRAGPGPTCAQARAFVADNPHWDAKMKSRIYSRVRPSQQPCP